MFVTKLVIYKLTLCLFRNATEELKDNTSTDEEIDRLAELRNERAREIRKGMKTG